MDFVSAFKNAGGYVTVGTDAGFIYQTYGFTYLQELELVPRRHTPPPCSTPGSEWKRVKSVPADEESSLTRRSTHAAPSG